MPMPHADVIVFLEQRFLDPASLQAIIEFSETESTTIE
jgi:hypothetical protein